MDSAQNCMFDLWFDKKIAVVLLFSSGVLFWLDLKIQSVWNKQVVPTVCGMENISSWLLFTCSCENGFNGHGRKYHECDPGYGADAFYDLVYKKPQLMMMLGSACSDVTKTLGEIVPYWNLLLVSFAARSPALSDREKYPTFFRLALADSSLNAARLAFIQHFGWTSVAILNQDTETFSLAIDDLTPELERVNITVKAQASFRGTGADDIRLKMLDVKDSDARIIIGSFEEDAAQQVFCEAYQQGMYGLRYVWMLVGSYTARWWEAPGTTACSPAQLAQAVNGYFAVDSLNAIIGDRVSTSGMTTEQFLAEYDQLNVSSPRSTFAQLTYDSVWTVALTLARTQKLWKTYQLHDLDLAGFNYRAERMRKTFFSIMERLEFMGISGPVSFNGPDRRGVSVLKQNQGGNVVRTALFYPQNTTLDFKCHGCQTVVWPGKKVPADKYTIIIQQLHIQPEAFSTIVAAATVGIFLASGLLAFNLYHRKLKYIKLSSPKLNNMAVVGCILVYMAVIFLGLDDATLQPSYFPYVCTVRAFLLSAGFSLAFGAMFTKTYRVHQIFTRAHSGLVKSKLLKDKQLLIMVLALLGVDCALISLWAGLDPMHRTVRNFTAQPSEEDLDLLLIPQLSKCHSRHLEKWLGAFYAYKGLLLLFGVYMAWETRHVKIPVLNDSQYIGMNIYNVVLMSVTAVLLSSLLTDNPTLSYAVVSALILLSTTGMLGLLFLPKIYAILKHNGSPVITSSGLTVEANTRRFAVDEKKELYYRAEVQNRVYKRELIELDQEISRLERLLETQGAPPTYDSLHSDFRSRLSGESPLPRRDRRITLSRCLSISDADDVTGIPELSLATEDVCTELPDISAGGRSDVTKQKLEKQDSGFHTMSFHNTSFKTAEQERQARQRAGFPRDLSEDSSLEGYHTLRRQGSYDGDHEEKQSLLQGEGDGEVEERVNSHTRLLHRTGDPSIEAATVLVNTNGRGSHMFEDPIHHQDSLTSPDMESVELRDISSGGGSTHCDNPRSPSDGATGSVSSFGSSGTSPLPLVGQTSRGRSRDVRKLSQRGQLPLTEEDRQSRMTVLQRELSRIQKELQALGELEVEVSYV